MNNLVPFQFTCLPFVTTYYILTLNGAALSCSITHGRCSEYCLVLWNKFKYILLPCVVYVSFISAGELFYCRYNDNTYQQYYKQQCDDKQQARSLVRFLWDKGHVAVESREHLILLVDEDGNICWLELVKGHISLQRGVRFIAGRIGLNQFGIFFFVRVHTSTVGWHVGT